MDVIGPFFGLAKPYQAWLRLFLQLFFLLEYGEWVSAIRFSKKVESVADLDMNILGHDVGAK